MTAPCLHPQLVKNLQVLYQDLHQNPELPLQEHRTAERVALRLRMLDYEVTEHVGGTGVVGILRRGEGPVVMLRSELDALPLLEKTGLPYASTVRATGLDGLETAVMHACGHDMHITCLIGAATLLAQATDAWSGTLMLVFQPAEELACGAQNMVDDGLFDRFPTPDVVLGQHVIPAPAGTIGYGSGAIMAAMDAAQVVLHGRGGHGSRPETTVDPVLMAAHIVTRLQGVVSREIAASETAVVTVGRLAAGTKDNIIPDTAELGISVRSFSTSTRTTIRRAIERIIRSEADASAAPRPPEVTWNIAAPVTENDPDATALTIASLTSHFGEQCITVMPPVTGSEDVGVFGAACKAPTVFWFLGGLDPADFAAAVEEGRQDSLPTNHSPHFAPVVEPTLHTGIQALVVAATAWLGAPDER
ncbi:amidohydrolase [Streptomyces spongiae]|uniref:Amidohydrolase n=1 Tax=Streptomyces spongiae TaxID=565072 RepID=A0A5N8X9S8_9ACTN|nr:amidohydrolase [Streptomyces spongiae]MPY55648.1 amidohydrolase [Streptomyces spongiae]